MKNIIPKLAMLVCTVWIAGHCQAVEPITGVTYAVDPADGVVSSTTVITSFSTAQGSVNSLSHAISANGVFARSTVGSDVQNSWGSDGAEIDGPQAVMNLDLATGLVNVAFPGLATNIDIGNTGGTTSNYMFSQTINTGTAGLANDFFIFENGGNDTIDIVPLNASGSPIGDFTLAIADTDWGILAEDYSRSIEGTADLTTPLGGVAFELSDFTGSGSLTGVQGFAISGDAGLDPLVIGVNNALAPAAKPTLTVNRLTGAATLSNEGTVPLDLLGYQFSSEFGALNPGNWLSIADEYDATSGGEVDTDDEWSELSVASDRDDLSEFAFGGPGSAGNGGTLAAGQSIPLSNASGIWLPTFNEELTGVVAKLDGSQVPVTVVFTDNGNVPLIRSDLDSDGNIDADDWQIVNDNYRGDFSSLSLAETYLAGDITGDGINDLNDYLLFVSDFDDFNGAGAFQAMLAGNPVPEPTSLALVGLVGGVLALRRVRRAAIVLLLAVGLFGITQQAEAIVIAADNFNSYDLGTDISDGSSGGVGWTNNWGGTTAPTSLEITDEPFTGYGRGVTIVNRSSSDNNILSRQFAAQTGDVYVGFSMRHDVPSSGDDFLHFYFNDTTANSSNDGIGGGVFRGSDQVGNYKVRIGGNGSDSVQTNSSTYGADQTFVFKLSKSAGTDYDEVSMWANQATEGTPDASLNAGAGNALSLTQISTFHLRWTPLFPSGTPSEIRGTLDLDNLAVATTYDEALSLVNNPDLKFAMSAMVNSISGEVTLTNNTASPITFDTYELVSDTVDTLAPGGWSSLASQSGIHPLVNPVDGDDPGSTAGDGVGEAWAESGTPNANAIAEQFLLGDTTLGVGDSISLGNIYDTTVGDTFNGRYTAAGELLSMDIEFFTPSALAGDFNADGVVNLADYTVWRDHLGGAESSLNGNGDDTGGSTGVVDAADYALWKTNFGNTAGAASGLVDATTIPEPTSWILLLLGGLVYGSFRRPSFARMNVAACLCSLVAVVLVTTQSAQAVVTPVREYTMGDTAEEEGMDNGAVSSSFGEPFDVLDSVEVEGEFQDLDAIGAPIYHQITAQDVTDGHPGPVSSFGIEFTGPDGNGGGDFLSVGALNSIGEDPPVSQGLQVWVYPHSASLGNDSRQSIVSDSNQAGGPAISPTGTWGQLHGGFLVDGEVAVVGDTWHHVAQHVYLRSDADNPDVVPGSGAQALRTSVLYVNGIAVSASNSGGIGASGEFMVGAAGNVLEPIRFFDGVMDELKIYTSAPDGYDYLADNDYVANTLIPALPGGSILPGDANLDGVVNAADATHFISNWRREKVLEGSSNSIYVGDMETRGWGDLDFNGRVDIDDALELHAELILAGAGGLNFGQLTAAAPIPEPSTCVLLILGLGFVAKNRLALPGC